MRVDIPRGAHGNLLVGIREDPECMNDDYPYSHIDCGDSDIDECMASEFTYDARGLISTFRKELMTKASHSHRIILFPAYFTAEELAAARLATRPTTPVEGEGARYVTFPIHTSRRSYSDQYGAGDVQRTPVRRVLENYMEQSQRRFDQMIDRYVSRQPAEERTLFDFINQPTDEPNVNTDFTEGME
jgi:hypothetical protein